MRDNRRSRDRGEGFTRARMDPALRHIDSWIFDLDNTLYPARTDLFGQIDVRMGEYIARLLACDPIEARRVQKSFFHSHGTTLSGLMEHHGVAPDDFLDYVHDIDLSVVAEDRRLVAAIGALPGRKLVFTNGDETYARQVLARIGLSEAFEAVHDIHACGYRPKPDPASYAALCEFYAIDPARALFAEDMARNLKPAKALGMATLWIDNGSERGAEGADAKFIDYETDDLSEWLGALTGMTG